VVRLHITLATIAAKFITYDTYEVLEYDIRSVRYTRPYSSTWYYFNFKITKFSIVTAVCTPCVRSCVYTHCRLRPQYTPGSRINGVRRGGLLSLGLSQLLRRNTLGPGSPL
jgi:hypothetical protein